MNPEEVAKSFLINFVVIGGMREDFFAVCDVQVTQIIG